MARLSGALLLVGVLAVGTDVTGVGWQLLTGMMIGMGVTLVLGVFGD